MRRCNRFIFGVILSLFAIADLDLCWAQPSTVQPSTVQPRTVQSDLDSRLELAGLESPEEVRLFLASLKQHLERDDRAALVSMIRLPLKIYSGSGKTYTDSKSLISDFDQVFTAKVRAAISTARYEDVFVNYQGAMLGDGEIWFDKRDGKVQIKAINP